MLAGHDWAQATNKHIRTSKAGMRTTISSLLCNCDGGVRFGVVSVSPVPAESRLKSGFFARKPCGTGFFESGFKSAFFPILERNVGR